MNTDARNLAKRRKVLDVSGQGIFNTLHNYIKRFPLYIKPDYTQIANDLKADQRELYDWILTNGHHVRRELCSWRQAQ